jgi:hypothetical protein
MAFWEYLTVRDKQETTNPTRTMSVIDRDPAVQLKVTGNG